VVTKGEFFSATNMQRLIARLMLLVLLAGPFSPLAGAMAMPAMPDHCMRKALVAAAEAMPGCHHHAARATSAANPARELAIRSTQCCNGHACCRSLVRSQWAQVCCHSNAAQIHHAGDQIFRRLEPARRLQLTSGISERAPPRL
jgi:hypothetical protein